jgi:hypothetical protein
MIFLKYFSQIKVHQVFLLFFPLAVAFGGTVNPVYAGPKKVTQFSFDRFIPERLTDPVDISLRQARLLGVFDHQSEDLADYIYRDAISQGLYGVSLEEGRRGGILYQQSRGQREAGYQGKIARILQQRDYQVHQSIVKRYDAPGFVNDYYLKTLAGYQGNFALALDSYSPAGIRGNHLYVMIGNGVDRPTPSFLGNFFQISFMKWITEHELFVGFLDGSWVTFEIRPSAVRRVIHQFNAAGAPHLRYVNGVHYLPDTEEMIVGYSGGGFQRVSMQSPLIINQLTIQHTDITAFEFSHDNRHLAVATQSAGVFIYQWPSLDLVHNIPVSAGATKALAWHPLKPLIAIGTGSLDHRVMIYDVRARRVKFEQDVTAQVMDIAWTQAGTELVATLGYVAPEAGAGVANSILVWSVIDQQEVFDVRALNEFPTVFGRALSMFVSSEQQDGRSVITIHALNADLDGSVVLVRFTRSAPKKEQTFGQSRALNPSDSHLMFDSKLFSTIR